METLSWTSDQITEQFASCESLGAVIKQIETDLWSRGHVLCGIKVNGMTIDEDDELKFASSTLVGVNQLEVQSQSPGHLVHASIDSQLKLLPDLEKAALHCAECFRRMEINVAQTELVNVLDGCRWLTDSLALIKDSARNWSEVQIDAASWAKVESSYKVVVREILAAVETKDFILLADLLEYELTNGLQGWIGILSTIDKGMPKP